MNQAQSTPPYFPWLHRLSVAGLIVTIALTCGIGGTITSAEVGMAYPTWPDINGSSLFELRATYVTEKSWLRNAQVRQP